MSSDEKKNIPSEIFVVSIVPKKATLTISPGQQAGGRKPGALYSSSLDDMLPSVLWQASCGKSIESFVASEVQGMPLS